MPTQPLSPSISIPESPYTPTQDQLSFHQVGQLFSQAPLGIFASLLNGSIVGFLYWDIVSNRNIMIWLVCLITINVGWCGLVYGYRLDPHREGHIRSWSRRFLTGNMATGMVWGALAIFLYPQMSTPHEVFLAFVIGGMVAGSTGVHSASQGAFLAFSLPAALPIIIRFFYEGSQFHIAMGGMGVLFLTIMVFTMRRNHQIFSASIQLNLENSNLISHLSDERDRAEELNHALSSEVQHRQTIEKELLEHREQLEALVEGQTHELRTSEARFRFLAENITDLIWMMSLDGSRFSYMSTSVERLLGYTVKEISVLSLGDVLTVSSYEKARIVIQEEIVYEQQHPVDLSRFRTVELEHRRKDGSTFWAEIRASFIRDEQGAIIGFVGVTRDVTERKKMDEEKKKLETQLLGSQKIEAIGTLAGGIAHDFNNLLTGVLGNISLSKGLLSPEEPSLKFLLEAEHESLRAKDLSQQLLTFAKGGEPIKQLTSLDVLVRNTVEFALSGSSVARQFIYEEPLWPVEADVGQMGQVFQNIVINALQAMPNAGTLMVYWENVMLDQSQDVQRVPLSDGAYTKISFVDNGVGITPEDLSKIFDPYFTTKSSNHGLGLTSVYTIVQKHGGHIMAESQPNHGTSFILFLPACPQSKVVRPSDSRHKKRGEGKVLVMDDEESIRVLASEMLKVSGYFFEMAKNGEEAISLYQRAQASQEPFSAVILDLTVPGGLGGKEAMEKLLEIDPQVKAIVSSGYSNDPIMAEYRSFGFQAVMTKPYSLQQLSEVMFRVVMESPQV